ncbi:MAG: hypothetical protein LBR18_02375 [Tannerella sp.]|jgi:hypothetical protein|nr:hypothetical protein [Tannerella sp.]
MQAVIQNYNLSLPVSDAGFLRTLSKKLGWTVAKAKAAPAVKAEEHSPLYYDLQSAFHDVRLMLDGKKKKKTAQEFLYELRNNND